MKFFCANCGVQLKITRKALPKLGTIIDLVETHTCLEKPVDPMSIIVQAPISTTDQNKFIESLNELALPKVTPRENPIPHTGKAFPMTSTNDLRDRRFEKPSSPTSSAPLSVLDQIKQLNNSIPANDFTDSEMEG